MTEQKQEGYRLMHHSRRIPLCADSKSAGPYFAAIKEDFTILYPEQTPKDLYRYELQYYQDTFTEWAEEKRENHIKSRHTRRIQTPRTIYENPQRCPEELTVQIGTQASSLKADAVLSCMNDYLQWMLSLAQNGEAPHILWAAVEKKAPYRMIIRRVWTYLDENGIYKISQTKLLNRMGFYPEEEGETKFQNIKIEFDQISRKMMEEICIAHGITLKGIPRISTLRQAMDWYKTVQAESDHAKQLLTGLTKREEESSAEELEGLTVHRTGWHHHHPGNRLPDVDLKTGPGGVVRHPGSNTYRGSGRNKKAGSCVRIPETCSGSRVIRGKRPIRSLKPGVFRQTGRTQHRR